jgi:hypothetical protein
LTFLFGTFLFATFLLNVSSPHREVESESTDVGRDGADGVGAGRADGGGRGLDQVAGVVGSRATTGQGN